MAMEEHTTAAFLDVMVERGARNRLDETARSGVEGAHAALETFYHAFNTRSLDLFRQIWVDDPLIQLNNPVGGIVRGAAEIAALYGPHLRGAGTRPRRVIGYRAVCHARDGGLCRT